MRLFADGTFYLSPSSKLSADYLCDRDTTQQFRNTGVLLSTVVQMQICDRDTRLYPPDVSIYDDCEDVCDWLHASAHNIAWMIDYFNVIESKVVRLFKSQPLTYNFKRALLDYMCAFDDADTLTCDWLPQTPSQARAEYEGIVKRIQYRKVRPPWWMTFADSPTLTPYTGVNNLGEPEDVDLGGLLLSESELADLLGPVD